MKPLSLVAVSALALTAAACGPKTPPARAALDCPLKQGELMRTSASPDGKACTYTTSDGAEVTLQLVSVAANGVDGALTGIETTLLANRQAPEPAAEVSEKDAAKATSSAAKAEAEAQDDAKGGVQMRADTDGNVEVDSDFTVQGKKADAVDVQLKDGKTVVTESSDGTTRVTLPGIRIVADETNDTADVRVGPIRINAGDDGATIRMRRDVRLRGEQFNPEKRGVRAMFLYTGDDLPDGYRYVGYEAGGPKRGPIAVAVVKSKSEHSDAHDVADDVRRLVRKNGGV